MLLKVIGLIEPYVTCHCDLKLKLLLIFFLC